MSEILLMEEERQVHLVPHGWADTSPTTREYFGKVTINRTTESDPEPTLSILMEKYSVVTDKFAEPIWKVILAMENKVLFVSGLKWAAEEPQKVLIGLGTQVSRQHFHHEDGKHLFERICDIAYLLKIKDLVDNQHLRLEGDAEKRMLSEQRYYLHVQIQDVSDKKDDNLYKSCDRENCPNRKMRFTNWEFRCPCGNRSEDYKCTLKLRLTLSDLEHKKACIDASIFHKKAEQLLGHSTEELEDMTDRGHRRACDAVIDRTLTVRLKARVFPNYGAQKLYFDVDAIL